MITREMKDYYLNASLDDKVKRSKQLIFEWYHQFGGQVYVAFSGGKDSTVLLHLGVMAIESNRRMTNYYQGECNSFKAKHPTSKPISFWTDTDIWAYIHKNNLEYCNLYDKGCDRTGCTFCMFGAHLNKERYDVLKKEYPKIYEYCMEKLRMREILKHINKDTQIDLFEE